jgi:hypothetical protein
MPHDVDPSVRVGFFSTVAQADQAIRNLLAAGFAREEIAIICPLQFKDQLAKDETAAAIPEAQEPGNNALEGIATGGIVGATLGGIALAAAAIGTAGAALVPSAIAVLVGGGAIAGGFSGLIVADGYGKGVGEYYDQATQLGKIVVGVQIEGEDSEARLGQAARLLAESGAEFLTPANA